ncbi:gephyrin-like molybdotransferase receptor GlpR [Corynebacterium halotolerans]|uniref:Uncharacterized protein n=1 Tax=Corynebacterium halotolerans YIM 70093 = DSM 44683 TaxID=1121362 RepID=M1P5F6_9CORY|nr:gephyrin-like molybdotransferase receptor GlpR [Corynebacterium halotolerans]AGF71891.1 hypothetical protein A605_04400 [Corynebacterium halotolerans YIM 70093 = DSM 44683]
MSGSLIIVLIIVVWLFVLAPLLLRGQKPIRKAGEAFDDTRVVYEGGSGGVPARRRPRLRPGDVRHPGDDDDDYEVVAADLEDTDVHAELDELDDDVLIDDGREGTRRRGLFARRGGEEETVDEVVDGDIVHELEPARTATATATAVSALEEDTITVRAEVDDRDEPEEDQVAVDELVAEDAYDYDDSYVSPRDMLYPDSDESLGEAIDEDELGGGRAVSRRLDELPDDDLSEEEIEFAERRRGRGGWDPVADAEHSLSRYQRRQRTLLGLGVAVVVTAVLGFVLGGWFWFAPALAIALTVAYLAALRSQVRQEQALRSRRIRQLRRARLGVRQVGDDSRDLTVPGRLRRPGAVVLELDDESPDFTDLPTATAPFIDRPDNGVVEYRGRGRGHGRGHYGDVDLRRAG